MWRDRSCRGVGPGHPAGRAKTSVSHTSFVALDNAYHCKNMGMQAPRRLRLAQRRARSLLGPHTVAHNCKLAYPPFPIGRNTPRILIQLDQMQVVDQAVA
jgi:hypothetical protein